MPPFEIEGHPAVAVKTHFLKHAMTQFLVLCYWGRAGLDGHTSGPTPFTRICYGVYIDLALGSL
jgi:hypothetical protein